MNPVDVHPTTAELAAFAFGTLPAGEADRIAEHLQGCAHCLGLMATVGFAELTRPLLRVPEGFRGHPRYEIITELGRGDEGTVFRARDKRLNRPVAIKTLHPGYIQSEAGARRFFRTIEVMAHLAHPNIAKVFDADVVRDNYFIVMEHVEGTDLASIIREKGVLPIPAACNFVGQVADGLQHAHWGGMIHRDLKPANLMVTSDGMVKILDFDLARIATVPIESKSPQEGAILGTPAYVAPEQIVDPRKADIRSDLYSLGVILYQLLAGRRPFEGSTFQILESHRFVSPPPLTSFREDLPKELVRVVERLMEKDPTRRYQTPAELAKALSPFAGSDPKRSRGVIVVGGGRSGVGKSSNFNYILQTSYSVSISLSLGSEAPVCPAQKIATSDDPAGSSCQVAAPNRGFPHSLTPVRAWVSSFLRGVGSVLEFFPPAERFDRWRLTPSMEVREFEAAEKGASP